MIFMPLVLSSNDYKEMASSQSLEGWALSTLNPDAFSSSFDNLSPP